MTAVEAVTEILTRDAAWSVPSPADLAAAAFLARYSNRTFEAYRHDLRT
jgi:integrase/recombinase XerD